MHRQSVWPPQKFPLLRLFSRLEGLSSRAFSGLTELAGERIAAEPDITLAELQAWLLAERKVKVSVGCLWNRLNFLKLSLKKSRSELPSRIGQMWPKRGMSGVRARAS